MEAPRTPSPALEFEAQRATELTRDECVSLQYLRCYTIMTYQDIAIATRKTACQVQRVCTGPVTPQKHKPRRKAIRTLQKVLRRE